MNPFISNLFSNRIYTYSSSFLLPIHFIISGSRWSKKLLIFMSRVAIASISSVLSSKSKILKFSLILSFLTDFGIATTPLCVSQRTTTWQLDFFCTLLQLKPVIHSEKVVPAFGKWSPGFNLNLMSRLRISGFQFAD